ncbi:MAG: hypothetical protein IJN64_03210 [Lachnospiraceae bacterium]|nr:hypothetical protein [Lachnospiraceae bacterium]
MNPNVINVKWEDLILEENKYNEGCKEIKSQIVAMNNKQLECIEWEKFCENEY